MCYKLDRVGHGDDIIKCVERWIKAVDYLEQKGKKKEKRNVYRAVKWLQGSLERSYTQFNSDETSAVWEKQVKRVEAEHLKRKSGSAAGLWRFIHPLSFVMC